MSKPKSQFSKGRKPAVRKLATPFGRPFPKTLSSTQESWDGESKPARSRDFRDSRGPRGPRREVREEGPRITPLGERPIAPIAKPPSDATVLKKFDEIWNNLFTSPVHLDSALSKQTKNVKTILAQILPSILLRPVSQAETMGVGVAPNEPWCLQSANLAHWRVARQLAQRLYQMMSQRNEAPSAQPGDFPNYMVEYWEKTWGREAMLDLVETLGSEAPLSLRAARKFGAKVVLDRLSAGSRLPVKAQLSNLTPLGVRLSGYAPILGTELYKEGAFEIQDEGSQLMALFALWPELFAPALQKRPGRIRDKGFRIELPVDTQAWTVVDACAGAGGKSLALSDALKGKGRIYAYDTSVTKLQALRRRATHANLNNIQTVALKQGEEAQTIGKFKRRAHVVLVDAPCSGWGVLRRNPDIKWRQTPDVLERMPQIQLRLLSQYAELVAGEGRLIFGVCTFRKEETVDIVQRFLEEHPEFEATHGGYLGPGPCDGFFMQCFVRRKQKKS